MENREQIERIEFFLNTVVLEELGKLQDAGLTYMHFVIMGQAVEVLGIQQSRSQMVRHIPRPNQHNSFSCHFQKQYF